MSNTAKREYILTAEGAVMRRDVSEYELDISQEIVARLMREHVVRVPNIWEFQNIGTVGLGVYQGNTYYTVSLSRLVIRAPWHPDGDVLVPAFGSSADPVMTVTWIPPIDCKLKLVVWALPDPSRGIGWNGSWLFALDPKGITYRLPIANVHDDCSCCTGMGVVYGPNGLAMLIKVIENFDQAKYNQDLLKSNTQTQAFFRVNQTKEGFTTIPTDNWSALCIKVSSAIAGAIV